jgi:hypothetical protein
MDLKIWIPKKIVFINSHIKLWLESAKWHSLLVVNISNNFMTNSVKFKIEVTERSCQRQPNSNPSLFQTTNCFHKFDLKIDTDLKYPKLKIVIYLARQCGWVGSMLSCGLVGLQYESLRVIQLQFSIGHDFNLQSYAIGNQRRPLILNFNLTVKESYSTCNG